MLIGRKLLLVVFVATMAGNTWAQDPPPLRESDVLKLIELQPSDDVIVSRLQASQLAFEVDEAVLSRFERAGASEVVLAALTDDAHTVRYEPFEGDKGGALTVEGTGNTSFSVRDADGKLVAQGRTGDKEPIIVAPGTYQLKLGGAFTGGFSRPVVVEAGKRAIVATGEVCVLSVGEAKGDWMWRLPLQEYRAFDKEPLNASIELFAGDWYVKPGSSFLDKHSERRITVRSGRKLTLETGAIKPIEGANTIYLGKQELTRGQWAEDDIVHLFPGEYDVWHIGARTGRSKEGIPFINSVKVKTVKVEAGKLEEVPSPY